MKIRMNSKKTIIGLAIGTGLIAGLSVLISGAETRAFNPAETARAVTAGMAIDQSQENGGYVASKVSRPHLMVFDEGQENGSSFTANITANDDFYWPTALEDSRKLTSPQAMVIDQSQENGSI